MVDGLSDDHEVTATDTPEATASGIAVCALDADDATNGLVAGIEAVVHVARLSDGEAAAFGDPSNGHVDFHSRATYNLLTAATDARVGHVIYLSSLDLFASCDDTWDVTERWQPRPTTDAPTLRHAIGEFTVREFAREGCFPVTCLRLGKLDGDARDTMRQEDLVRAVGWSLAHPPRDWAIYHIQSDVSERRFDVSKAIGAGLVGGKAS